MAQTILSQWYGNLGGIEYNALNQGRINADNDDLQIRNWTSDNQTIFDQTQYGIGSRRDPCPPVILPPDDYIIGFKIYENPDLKQPNFTFDGTFDVGGLELYTLNGLTFSCIGSLLKVQ